MMPQTMIPQRVPLRFSVDDYYKMIDLGMLKDYEKAEIIDGQLIKTMTIGDRHAQIVNKLTKILVKTVSDDILVSVQNPLRLTDFNEPEPDLVLADLTKYDGSRHPRPNETLIVIEVSDASLKYDRETKLQLYAVTGIKEAWLINLPKNLVEIHTNLSDDVYQTVKLFKLGETIKSEFIPDLEIEVDKILG